MIQSSVICWHFNIFMKPLQLYFWGLQVDKKCKVIPSKSNYGQKIDTYLLKYKLITSWRYDDK